MSSLADLVAVDRYGDTPAGWRKVLLREVCQIQLGKMLSPKSKTGTRPRPYLRNANVQWGRFDLRDIAEMDFSEGEEAKFTLRPGDLLVCEGGEPGRAAVWDGQIVPCYYQKALHRLRPLNRVVDPHFVMYRLWFATLRGEFVDSHAQSTIAHLPAIRLAELPIEIPPLVQQQRIVAVLREQMGAVDQARAAAEDQLSVADTLPAAYLRAVFNSSLAKAWPTRTIGEVAKVQSGFAFKSEWFAANGIRLLRNANIFQGYVAWDDEVRLPIERQGEFGEYELSVGDVVLSLDRPVVSNGLKVARLTAADVPALLLQRVGRFRLSDSAEPDYFYAFLNSETFIAAITQHDYSLAVPHVSPKQVEAVAIPLPPLPEQRRISAVLRDQMAGVERSRKALQEQLDAINALPATLLRRAFSGEL